MNLSTGNEIVDKIGQINISGNIIPKIWFSTITKKDSNKPYYLAILILADIVYWYRPTEVRDETTGSLIGFKKRFKSDLLQRSYAAFEKEFGENEQVIRRALSRLEELGLIKRVLRTINQNGMLYNNVMYISLSPEKIIEYTYPEKKEDINNKHQNKAQEPIQEPMDDTEEYNENILQDTNITPGIKNDTRVVSKITPGCYQKQYQAGVKNDTTNTKITTKITTKNQSINPRDGNMIDEIDEIMHVKNIIKSNIDYDTLVHDKEDKDYLDTITEIMTEAIAINKDKIRISGIEYPCDYVKDVLLKLNSEHIRYVMNCLENNTTKIKKIDSYILTSLYNSYKTIGSYYKTRVNNEVFGGTSNL